MFLHAAIAALISLHGLSAARADDTAPPRILSAKLMNPVVSAGEKLDIRIQAIDDSSGIQTVSGTDFWLGFIVQNVFPQSDALNRSAKPVPGSTNEYAVDDLVVNPWVVPTQPEYTVEMLRISDRAGNFAALYSPSKGAQFYVDDHNRETEIPVIRFQVRDNPEGDNTGPTFLSAQPLKQSYRPGDAFDFEFEATDDRSGVEPGCCAGIITSPNVLEGFGGNLSIRQISGNRYRVEGARIRKDAVPQEQPIAIEIMTIYDRSWNFGEIRRSSPQDTTYSQQGKPTSIPIATFTLVN